MCSEPLARDVENQQPKEVEEDEEPLVIELFKYVSKEEEEEEQDCGESLHSIYRD